LKRRTIALALLGAVAALSLQAGPALAARGGASGVCGGIAPTPGYVWGPNCTEVLAP